MIYYPKSKILENQFTSGKEFVIKRNNNPYTGYYYILSNNTYFTGKTMEEENTEELIKAVFTPIIPFIIPSSYYPIPTDNDYQLGFLTRYFLKRRNADYTTIKEISLFDYNTFQNDTMIDTNLYVTTKLNWRIGSLNDKSKIEETNRKLVSFKEGIFPGFSYYFKDYTQFSK